MTLRMKEVIFAYYGWIAALCLIGILSAWLMAGEAGDWRAYTAAVGTILTTAFLLQKQKLDEAKLFKELFAEFNMRYEALNTELSLIAEKGNDSQLSRADMDILIKYFNLSGEEYLMFRKGYVYSDVWRSWCAGMDYYYGKTRIREFWDRELAENSYYGFSVRQCTAQL